MEIQKLEAEMIAVGELVLVKFHEGMGLCRAQKKSVQGTLIESIETLERIWVPHHWLEKAPDSVSLPVPELIPGLADAIASQPVHVTVPDQVQLPPVPVLEAVGSIDPQTGLWVRPVSAPDAGVL